MQTGLYRPGIPSKKFTVYQRLYGRYKLEPRPAEETPSPDLSTTILPTTDADKLLRVPSAQSFTVTVAGTGSITAFTIPAGERWTVYFLRAALASGTWTFSRFDLLDPATAVDIPIDEFTATGVSELFEPRTPLVMDERWDLQVNIAAFTSGGDLQMKVFAETEDAF